jgi:hypothetical protein
MLSARSCKTLIFHPKLCNDNSISHNNFYFRRRALFCVTQYYYFLLYFPLNTFPDPYRLLLSPCEHVTLLALDAAKLRGCVQPCFRRKSDLLLLRISISLLCSIQQSTSLYDSDSFDSSRFRAIGRNSTYHPHHILHTPRFREEMYLFYCLYYIVAYLLKARTVEPGNGYVTRNNAVTVGSGVFCEVRAEDI